MIPAGPPARNSARRPGREKDSWNLFRPTGTLAASAPGIPPDDADRLNGKEPLMEGGGQTRKQQTRGLDPAGPDLAADVVPVLMAGGFGTRLWPLSTPERPKQFLTEWQGRSLFQQGKPRIWKRLLL